MSTAQEVAPERTGWRDERISMRHRKRGFDCPALDIDFLLLEYDHGLPSALAKFKHENVKSIHVGHPSIRALQVLANRGCIPFFLVRYADDFSWYYVTPGNDNARAFLAEPTKMPERDWVELLYRCRGREIPEGLSEQLV